MFDESNEDEFFQKKISSTDKNNERKNFYSNNEKIENDRLNQGINFDQNALEDSQKIEFTNIKKLTLKTIIFAFAKLIFDYGVNIYWFIQSKILIILMTVGALFYLNFNSLQDIQMFIGDIVSLKDQQVKNAMALTQNQKKITDAKEFSIDSNSIENVFDFLIFLSKNKPNDSHIESIDINFNSKKANLVVHAKNMQSLSSHLNVFNKAPSFLSLANVDISNVQPKYFSDKKDDKKDLNVKAFNVGGGGNNGGFSQDKFNTMLNQLQGQMQNNNSNNNKINNVYAGKISFNIQANN